MNDTKAFAWAHGEKANVREPIESLRESGWRSGDTPTASNFNWLFKNISDQLGVLNKEISHLKQTLGQDITRLNDKSERLRRCVRVLEQLIGYNLGYNEMNESFVWQVNEGIKAMEAQIKALQPGYQPVSWPLINGPRRTHRDELSDVFDEIDRAEAIINSLEAERTED